MVKLTDTHCHLDFRDYSEDLDAVLDRAREAGVGRFLIPGIDLESSGRAVTIAQSNTDVFAAVGVHPNQAELWATDTLRDLAGMAQESGVVAIGEIGLDYYRMRSERSKQQQILQEQLELASEQSLPVVIHNREATRPVMKMLSEWHSDLVEFGSDLAYRPGVLHSYSDSLETAKGAQELSLFIGITGPITFKKAVELRDVVSEVPLDQLLIETDAPFLSPEPRRGRRNEPAHVRFVAEKIAELHETTFDVIAEKTSDNAQRLFLW